jgi:hypothetical protein
MAEGNTGKDNSGDLNSGNRNSGNRNSGDRNSGIWNSGNRNSGNRNSGHLNSGSWNSGNRNSGYLNSNEPTVRLFNKDTGKTFTEILNLIPPILWDLKIVEWVSFSSMTDAEKVAWPKAFVCDGYLKKYEYKEAWANLWKHITKEDIAKIKALPNFDSSIFEEITGIQIDGNGKKAELIAKAEELIAKSKEMLAQAEAM